MGGGSDVGTHTHIHVINQQIQPQDEPDILQIDLEAISPWISYCERMAVNRSSDRWVGKVTLLRPSAFCALGSTNLGGFTRGFLFYLFVGSLFEEVDMYGMASSDGRKHL